MSEARELPHSLEAEQGLLSSCLLDGKDVVQRCLDAKIGQGSFYDPKHGIIYASILRLHNAQQSVEIAIVAEDLKARNQLEQIGSFPFLVQVSDLIPTTAQAGYFIEKVSEYALLRETIRACAKTTEDCYNYSGGKAEFVAQINERFARLSNQTSPNKLRGALYYNELPPEDGPDELLGHNRYLGRGDSCLIVSSSGMGKSSLTVLWACHIALGRDFLGIPTKRPSRSLIIQAEDSDGDVREQMYSAVHTMKLTEKEQAMLHSNVVIVRDKVNRGDAFITAMRVYIDQCKPDFVWLNPLHAYAGCEITDATQIGKFLRDGLNKANSEERFCYMIIHHTPKPMTGKAVVDKKWHEFMYDAAGSAEVVNCARGVVCLKPTDVEGEFNLVLAKRGKRAGVMQETQGEVNTFLQPTIKIAIKQSGETIEIPGRKRRFHLLNWELRVAQPEAEPAPKKSKANDTSYTEKLTEAEAIVVYPASDAAEGVATAVAKRAIIETYDVSEATFKRMRRKLVEDGLITQTADLRYKRTTRGDELAKEYLKKIP